MTRRCFSQPWLADALVKSKAGLRRLCALAADASEPPDEVLLEQIALLRCDHDGAAQALSRAKATVLPTVAIDAEMIGKFSNLLADKLANGDIHARKSYPRAMIDVVEIDDTLIPIVGRRSTLRNAISGRPASFANARWPVIYFSTALQAKSGGSNPVSAMSLFHRAISSPAPMVVIMES